MEDYYHLDIGGGDNNHPYFKDNLNNPFKTIISVFNELSSNNFPRKILIYGGEPTINPYFFKILTLIKKRKYKSLIILTNGRLFSSRNFLEKIVKFPNISFYIDIYASNAILHDNISTVKGSFAQTMAGIKNLSEYSNILNVSVPIIKKNIEDIKNIIDYLSNINISNIIFYLPNNDEGLMNNDIIKKIQKIISSVQYEKKILAGFENIPLCFFQSQDYYEQKNIFINIFSSDKKYFLECDKCNKQDLCHGFPHNTNNNIKKYIKPFSDIQSKIHRLQRNIQKKSVLDISIEEIFSIISYFKKENNLWKGVYDLGYPLPLLVLVLFELEKEKIVSIIKNKVKTLIEIPNIKKNINLSNHRFSSDPKVCQLLVSQDHLKKRVEYIIKTCSVGGKLVVIGDDDFMSINLASTDLFDEVLVFDIDKRIVDKINFLAKEKNLPLKCIKHDLRNKMQKRFLGKFDIVYTDSPYSPSGFSLFISRGISLLKNKSQKHLFSSFSCEMPVIEVELEVQRIINNMNLFLEQKSQPANNIIPHYLPVKFPSFEKINNAIYIDNKSLNELDKWYLAALGRKEFLFHFLTTKLTMPIINDDFYEEIYYKDTPLDFYTNPNVYFKDMPKNIKSE